MFTKEITNGMMPARMNLTVISVFILPKKCLSGYMPLCMSGIFHHGFLKKEVPEAKTMEVALEKTQGRGLGKGRTPVSADGEGLHNREGGRDAWKIQVMNHWGSV